MKFHFPSFLNNFQEMRNHAETNGSLAFAARCFHRHLAMTLH